MSEFRTSWPAAAALVTGGLLVAVVLAEVALRWFVPPRAGTDLARLHELRPDKPWLYGMRPGVVVEGRGGVRYEINSAGFRGAPPAPRKEAATLRIAVLGDSVTFGYGVNQEDTFSTLLAERLARDVPARRIEVLNLGVSGYNPYTEAALFADLGPTLAPDVVLVQFCINDLNDPTMHFDASTTAALGPLPAAAYPEPPAAPRAAPPDCHGLRLCELVRDVWQPRPGPDDPATIGATVRPHDPPNDRELGWLAERYGEIGRTARAIGAHPVLVIFPYATQLAPGAPSATAAALTRLAADLGWTSIDLLPAYREAAQHGAVLFADLWHPTVAGHRLAANVIADSLRRHGLLAPRETAATLQRRR
ncbi:MAG TPA: SGNH/GDSL hydrolase family protein [Candidatus Limnocylindria bacterium]|nr:SGNH/GDSL hydrolase family protein [Candidatus Limnocylindria bacterium]